MSTQQPKQMVRIKTVCTMLVLIAYEIHSQKPLIHILNQAIGFGVKAFMINRS